MADDNEVRITTTLGPDYDAILVALTDDEPRQEAWPIACLKDILDQLIAENWSAHKSDPESWDNAIFACRLMLSRLTAALRPVAERRAAEGNVPIPAADEDLPL